jgi:DNA-directed RNA polymerase specialized sigma24 family protein
MAIDDLKTVERLRKLVTRLTSNVSFREDLLQEALVHLWRMQQLQPGQTESWYLQGCRYHLQHHLAFGRSIDSPKRSSSRVHPAEDGEDHDSLLDVCDNQATSDVVRAEVSARDMVNSMSKRLTKMEQSILKYFADGLRPSEIARRLDISHSTVIKHRRRIASLAGKMGIPRIPKKTWCVLRQVNGEKKFVSGGKSVTAQRINGANAINSPIFERSVCR